MAENEKQRTPERAAHLLDSAPPDRVSTLWLLERSGLARHPTQREINRHIHPRRKRPAK